MPDLSVSYGRIAEHYEDARGGQRRADEVADAISPWLAPAARVLEIGAGTGVVSAALARRGFDPIPVDLSPEMLARAASRFPTRRAVADAVDLPLRDRCVDAVALVWVLHHVGAPEAALDEASRVLRPGGRIVVIAGPVSDAPDDEIQHVHGRLNDALRPGRVAVARDAAEIGGSLGLQVAARAVVPITYDSTPNQAADAIEARLYSHLWDLDAEIWRRVVEPAVTELRAMPEPDVVRRRVGRHPMVVFEAG